MGFLDRLLGRETPAPVPRTGAITAYPPSHPAPSGPQDSTTGQTAQDQAAIARYRYLLRTAPPERIEQVHAEAFARLTPQQRQAILAEMTRTLPPEEVPRADDPQDMARAATRAEMSRPGYLQNTLGRPAMGMGMGMGGMFAGSMLGTIAGVVVGSAIADTLLGGFEQSPEAAEAGVGESSDSTASESADSTGDSGSDVAAADYGSGDTGDPGGSWDFGGDFGGGDFGGF